MGLICIIFMGTVCTAVVLHVQMRGNRGRPIPGWLRAWIRHSRLLRLVFKHVDLRRRPGVGGAGRAAARRSSHRQKHRTCPCANGRSSSLLVQDAAECKWVSSGGVFFRGRLGFFRGG